MSYYAGIAPSMAIVLGIPSRGAQIVCDGCGWTREVRQGDQHRPPAWFLDSKPPPGWSGSGGGTRERRDYCVHCTQQRRASRSPSGVEGPGR